MGAVIGSSCITANPSVVNNATDELPTFPSLLGPFAVVRTPFEADAFRILPKSSMWAAGGKPPLMGDDNEGMSWLMDKEVLHRAGFDIGDRFRLQGSFSPRFQITLKADAREAIRIPPSARTFMWSYPIPDWPEIHGKPTAVDSFLSVGGFVYLDKDYNVVGVNTLMAVTNEAPTKSLHFYEPLPWQPQWTDLLVKQKRFHLISIKAMVDVGAHYFCWLRPGEVISESGVQPHIPHGGFVYLFGKEPGEAHPYDRYFAVKLEADDMDEERFMITCRGGHPQPAVPFHVQDQKTMSVDERPKTTSPEKLL